MNKIYLVKEKFVDINNNDDFRLDYFVDYISSEEGDYLNLMNPIGVRDYLLKVKVDIVRTFTIEDNPEYFL